MTSIHVDLDSIEWTPGSAYKGPDALYQGQEVFYRKGLSDRRQEGGGLAVLSKICPPPWCLAEGYTLSGLLGPFQHPYRFERGVVLSSPSWVVRSIPKTRGVFATAHL
jgi:hypothetical protein